MIDLLRELVDTPSTTGSEAGVAAILERELGRDGYRVTRQQVAPGRDNLLATREGETPRILLSTHIDTVPPHIPYRREGDTVYGRGACDTKGGIVAMLEAGRRLRARGRGDFGYLFVVGEEVDHSGAKAAATLGLSVERIILCEPTVCRVIAAQKGVVKVRLEAEGRAAHSGFPHRGVSAVDRLLTTLEALRRHAWPRHDVLGVGGRVGRDRGDAAAFDEDAGAGAESSAGEDVVGGEVLLLIHGSHESKELGGKPLVEVGAAGELVERDVLVL